MSRESENFYGDAGEAGIRKIFESSFSKEIKIFCLNRKISQFQPNLHDKSHVSNFIGSNRSIFT